MYTSRTTTLDTTLLNNNLLSMKNLINIILLLAEASLYVFIAWIFCVLILSI